MPLYPKNISLLLSLNKDECKKFRKYLSSPYFNSIKKLSQLFELAIKEFKENEKNYCEDDFVHKVYGELKTRLYKDHLGLLGKHFKHFVALQYIEERALLRNQLVLEDHLHRGDGCFFMKQLTQTKKELKKLPLDLNQFQNEYQIEELFDTYIKYYIDNRVGDTNLQVLSDTIDRDFILKKLCCTVLMLNRSNIAKANYNFGMMQMVIDSLKENSFDEPLINLFYYAYEILAGEDKENAFEQLNKELLRSNQTIAKEMINALFSILQNNLKLLKSVKIQLHQQLFILYKIMITQQYIQDNGKISVSFYKNVVSIALELGEFDYAEKFIEEHKNKLMASEITGDVYAYNKTKLHIYKSELQNAGKLIKNLHFKDALYKFALKCLQIMFFYETKQFSLLESCMNAFEVALSPNRPPHISETNTKVYRNFYYCMKKLFRFNHDPNITKKDVQQLVTFIKNTHRIANRKWVLTKAEILLLNMR